MNLLHARRLARAHGWWHTVISAMQGLRKLYGHTGRRAEWKRLVEEIVPDFVDPESDRPLPEREEQWSLVTDYRVQLAQEEQQWVNAGRLQTVRVDRHRRRAAPALARPAGELESAEQNVIRALSISLETLGIIRSQLGQTDCVPAFEEARELSERISDLAGAAVCTFNLGHAFKNLPAIRDLDQAEHWYRQSLELNDKRDRLGRGRCLMQLGSVALERFKECTTAGWPEEKLLRHFNEAVRLYHEALDLLPTDSVNDLAVVHHQLGAIYSDAGDLDRAVQHCRESIRYEEAQGNLYGAAQARFNVAITLARAGRRADALEYAEAALRGFGPYGSGAAKMIEMTRGLIAEIRET